MVRVGEVSGVAGCSTTDSAVVDDGLLGAAHPCEISPRPTGPSRCCWVTWLMSAALLRGQHARVQHVSASSGSKNYHHQAHGRTEEWTTEAKCGRGGRWVVLDCAFTGRSSDRGARERCTQSWTRHRIEHSRRALRWPERSQPERVRGTESPLLHRVWQVAVAGQPASDDLVAFPARRVTGVFPA